MQYTHTSNGMLSGVLLLSNFDQTTEISKFFGDDSLGQEQDEKVSWNLVGVFGNGGLCA